MDQNLYEVIKIRVLRKIQDSLARINSVSDEEVIRIIEQEIINDRDMDKLSARLRTRMRKEIFNRIRRLDVLTDFISDNSVTEIMVNGTDGIFIEKDGILRESGTSFESKERVFDIACQIVAGVNRTVNMMNPIMDARLADGSRVNIVLDPIAINGPIITIRKFPEKPIDAERLIELGSVSKEVMAFLRTIVRAKYNILISGGTGSGKTTFLNICSGYIKSDERIITIEDSAELRIMNVRNLVRLETRNATAEGCSEISIRDLIKSALRMRPDRIIVGEVRGEEAIDMLQAFSVGQDGSLSTIHANNAEDALYRLETMIMLSTQIPLKTLRRQIVSGVDIIVQLGRLRDGSRQLMEVREVIGMKGDEIETKVIYMFDEKFEKGGKVMGDIVKCHDLYHKDKLHRAGIADGI